ncbi:DUF4376 domain-containing protein [Sphingomonas leidyi]|uniref:DUF4376 domain-containing protein n=1 Tax=Sphingomonas leidyi TaxID=68569 RepID=UPI0036D3C943
MTQLWTILDGAGAVVQPCCPSPDIDTHPNTCGEPWEPGYQAIPIDQAPDLNRFMWSGSGWVLDPARVRAIQWDAAKAIYETRIAAGFTLEGIGRVQTDAASREAIYNLADEAREKLDAGEPWATSFKNEENVRVPVTAEQIVAVYRALRAFLGQCFAAKEVIADALAAATTAEEVLGVNLADGYPA